MPISHQLWDDLLQKHVSPEGWVDYKGFIRDSVIVNQYLENLENSHPNKMHWSKDEQLAYWINAYNAFTVKLIMDHYPLKSIKDIKSGIPFVNSVWDIKFIQIEGTEYDLNNIEHGIIRKQFDEPRIHFAVNCASYSCPVLRGEAYTAEKLNAQLDDQFKRFLLDERRNILRPNRLRLSKIFKWYGIDFPKGKKFIDFLRPHTSVNINDEADIEYLDYNWELNDIKNHQ